MSQRSKEIWRRATIEETRASLRLEMSRVLAASDADGLLNYILKQIQSLQDTSEKGHLLPCFLLILEALHHQHVYGGLGKKQIQDLSSLAESILRVAAVRPRHTPTSFLHTELHGALSRLHSCQGEHWQALWELEIGNYAADLPRAVEAQQQLAMGLNALRLGQSEASGLFLQRALAAAEEPALRDEIQLQILRSKRLACQFDEAQQSASTLLQAIDASPTANAALWEKICIEASQSQDLGPMVNLTKKGQPLHQASYRIEFFLWAGCHPKTVWLQKSVKVSSSGTLKKLQQEGSMALYQIAQSLEIAYDSQIPFPRRLEEVKKVFSRIKLLNQVEHELLVWLFLARWLYRCHHYSMAKLCFGEYASLCNKLSEGRSRDVLGLAADLLEIDWLEKAA